MKKTYSASQARSHLAEVLNVAEAGETVVIERDNVRFQVTLEPKKRPRAARRAPLFDIVDPAIADGRWTWEWDQAGVSFVVREHKR